MEIITKKCNCCKEVKPLDDFPRAKCFKDGRNYTCSVCHNARVRDWTKRNNEYCLEKGKKWRDANRERYRANRRRQEMKRRESIVGRLHDTIHNGIWSQLKNGKKGRRTFALVGYTPEELKKHLEKQFVDGMSWENYGEWHLDHIIPLSAFNIVSAEDLDFKRCWALSNLRPLWAGENMTKGKRLHKPFQPALAIAA